MEKWEIIFICSSIALLPFMYLLLRSIIKDIKEIIGITKWEKARKINYKNYEELELKEIDVDYIIPSGQIPYFEFNVPDIQIAVKQKKYTGNTRGGIKLPFFRLSLQDKELYDTFSFMNWGECRITITNKKLKIVSFGQEPTRKEMTIDAIENIELVDDDRTVFVSLSENAYPVKVKLSSNEVAEHFQNALWTIKFSTRVTRSNSKKTNDKNCIDPMLDTSPTSLKKLSKNELQTIALDIKPDETILKLKKEELIDFIIKSNS